ncbi:MAG: TonB C-terminal domain-containing protein [Kofleriaceae bacterium]
MTSNGADSFPSDFTPPPPMPPPAPADPAAVGAGYLDILAARIQTGWAQFLEDCRLRLPPAHPLNSATLEATVAYTLDAHGGIVEVRLVGISGNAEFDDAVISAARDAGPFPSPETALLSDDDLVYVTWVFARDRRQAGAATAGLRKIEWGLERAVPKFLADGNLAEAARRVAAAPSNPVTLGFGERVMIAAVRQGLASADPAVQRLAVTAAGAAKLTSAARELRAIADGALDVALRGAAIAALAQIGDVDAGSLLLTILERDAGANVELTGGAAHALAVLGAGDALSQQVTQWLADGKAGKTEAAKHHTWAALIAMGGAPVPAAVPTIGPMVTSGDARTRGAACRALAASAAVTDAAWKPLGRGLKDADAAVRAACAEAIADAAQAGAKSRATFWLVAPLLRDRDERVRAAATLAMVRLEPVRAKTDLAGVARDKSALVQASLAEAAVRTGDLGRAEALLTHDQVMVRRAAASALATLGGDPGRARLAGHVDDDPEVAALVLAVSTDRAALTAAAGGADGGLAVVAARRLTELDGRAAGLAAAATAVAAAPAASAPRVNAAAAWLAAR